MEAKITLDSWQIKMLENMKEVKLYAYRKPGKICKKCYLGLKPYIPGVPYTLWKCPGCKIEIIINGSENNI